MLIFFAMVCLALKSQVFLAHGNEQFCRKPKTCKEATNHYYHLKVEGIQCTRSSLSVQFSYNISLSLQPESISVNLEDEEGRFKTISRNFGNVPSKFDAITLNRTSIPAISLDLVLYFAILHPGCRGTRYSILYDRHIMSYCALSLECPATTTPKIVSTASNGFNDELQTTRLFSNSSEADGTDQSDILNVTELFNSKISILTTSKAFSTEAHDFENDTEVVNATRFGNTGVNTNKSNSKHVIVVTLAIVAALAVLGIVAIGVRFLWKRNHDSRVADNLQYSKVEI